MQSVAMAFVHFGKVMTYKGIGAVKRASDYKDKVHFILGCM